MGKWRAARTDVETIRCKSSEVVECVLRKRGGEMTACAMRPLAVAGLTSRARRRYSKLIGETDVDQHRQCGSQPESAKSWHTASFLHPVPRATNAWQRARCGCRRPDAHPGGALRSIRREPRDSA